MIRQTARSRKIGRIMIILMMFVDILLLILFSINYVTNSYYEKKNKLDVFTIKVYYEKTREEIVEFPHPRCDYTGDEFDLIIKAFCNDELMNTYYLSSILESPGGRYIDVRLQYREFKEDELSLRKKLPKERGLYYIEIRFDVGKEYNNKLIHDGNVIDRGILLYIDYDYYINGKEYI